MSTTTRRATASAAAAALLLTAVQLTAAPALAAPADLEVVDVTVGGTGDVSSGFAALTVDVALRSDAGLPDTLLGGVMGGDTDMVVAERPGGTPWLVAGETPPEHIGWRELERVSGTANDGVWRGTTTVSRIHGGDWLVTGVWDQGAMDYADVSGLSAAFEVADGAPPAWVAAPAPSVAVKVVNGTEPWTPRGRVTDRATGTGIGAFWYAYNFYAEPTVRPAVRLPAGPLARADAAGYFSLTPRPVVIGGEDNREVIHVYAGRSSRGYSWETATTLWPYVKWQANERFATSGRTITATGNAWPAPSVYLAANPAIHLQHLVGRTWRTVASAHVRANGRYTIEWTAPSAGVQHVRVYKPGGSERGGTIRSAGTTLPAVPLTVS